MTARAGVALLAVLLVTACGPSEPAGDAASGLAAAHDTPAGAPWFAERAAATGLIFSHFNGATGEAFLAEIMGSGCALLDFDNDGDLDAYLVQGGRINDTTPLRFPATETGTAGALFENRLVPDGELAFRDVSATAGVANRHTGMGVATGDIDNDGDIDLYLSNLGPDALFINNGDGTFADRSATLDEAVSGYSASAAMLDYDRDGFLDIVVTRYVDMDRINARQCSSTAGLRDYCTPDVYRPMTDALLRGDGEGGFTAVAWQHPAPAAGTGLGVDTGDFDGDGWLDIYVANDKKPNQLWRNLGDGRFEDVGVINGAAFNSSGKEEASMGVGVADFDVDGDEDIFITHLRGETNTLYINGGGGVFFDGTIAAGLASPSIPATGFGTRWFDFDNDGDLDLFVANGAVMAEPTQVGSEPFPYLQRNQLFENIGRGKFADASRAAGLATAAPAIGRGAAFGDVDNDGDVDILVSNNHGPARLLINEAPRRGRWLAVRLVDGAGNRDGIGARIGIDSDEGMLWRRVSTGGSYLSASDVRTHFGLGDVPGTRVDVDVVWPDGSTERFAGVGVNADVTLTRGKGLPR